MHAWRKTHKEVVREFEVRRQLGVKIARQQTAAWWPNYNRVIQAYESSRQSCRKLGRRLRLHDHLRDDGVLTFQIQRTHSGLGAAPSELMDGTVAALQVGSSLRAGRRSRWLEFRVDSEGHILRIPIYLHREIPSGEGVRVKSAQLTWGRRSGKERWNLCLTVNMPAPAVHYPSNAVPARVSFGWRRFGGLEVLCVEDGDATRKWALPPRWLRRADLISERHAVIDEMIETGRKRFVMLPWIDVLAMRPLEMMERLQLSWEKLPASVREWYRLLRREWTAREGLRRHVLGERKQFYRLWAREIVARWPILEMPELDLAAIATAERGQDANSDRFLAAIHVLRAEILHQAAKVGRPVISSGEALANSPHEKSSAWARRKNLARQRSQVRVQLLAQAGK